MEHHHRLSSTADGNYYFRKTPLSSAVLVAVQVGLELYIAHRRLAAVNTSIEAVDSTVEGMYKLFGAKDYFECVGILALRQIASRVRVA